MTTLILKEGKFLGHYEGKGFLYKLNGSFYLYKSGEVKVINTKEDIM